MLKAIKREKLVFVIVHLVRLRWRVAPLQISLTLEARTQSSVLTATRREDFCMQIRCKQTIREPSVWLELPEWAEPL